MDTLVRTSGNLFPLAPSFFDDFFNLSQTNSKTKSTLPAVNIRENEEVYEIEVASPGFQKEDFNVELSNNTLVVSAEKQTTTESSEKLGNYTSQEFNYTSFSRSFRLPEKLVESEKIEGKYENGILYLSIPKVATAKSKSYKQIAIS